MIALKGMNILIEEKLADMRNVLYIEKAIISKFHMLGNEDSINLELDDTICSIEVTLGCMYIFHKQSLKRTILENHNLILLLSIVEQRHGIVIGHRTKIACQLVRTF